MTIEHTPLEGCIIIKPNIFTDERGFFIETFNQKKFNDLTNTNSIFVQDNQSYSKHGVMRGLHFQKGGSAQAKLVRVLKGEVLDVAVDLRSGSKTYGQHFSIRLSDSNNLQLLVPRGFAHGFVVLSDGAAFQYKCDNYYDKSAEGGVHYADPTLAIDWILSNDQLIVAAKDIELPAFEDIGELGF